MKNGLICPFCNYGIPETESTYKIMRCVFDKIKPENALFNLVTENNSGFDIHMLKCPTCNKVSFTAQGIGQHENIYVPIYPNSSAKQFPKYIPKAIREDYEEAYSILNLSPKASATLSRRCLQGMIHDFWKINKKSLYDEISALQEHVPTEQWKAIDAIRSLGNIGAHMEKDINTIIEIDSSEAEKLIKLIELLIDKWYVARHDEQELLKSIVDIDEDKKSQKKSN